MARFMLLVLSAMLLAACGEGKGNPPPRPGADQLPVEVVAFDPGGSASDSIAALSEEPIVWPAFAGWYGGSAADTDMDAKPADPGSTYVAVTAVTGCRAPEEVEVSLAGTDLRVAFTGGTEEQTCIRAFGPTAVLALPTDKVRDVRTVNGKTPLDAGGPGRLRDFVPLGTVPLGDVPPVELPDTAAMLGRLAESEHAADARSALGRPIPAGHRAFAFVLTGCAETGAVLLNDHTVLTADLTGNEDTQCDAPTYFLATFELKQDDVPNARLSP